MQCTAIHLIFTHILHSFRAVSMDYDRTNEAYIAWKCVQRNDEKVKIRELNNCNDKQQKHLTKQTITMDEVNSTGLLNY